MGDEIACVIHLQLSLEHFRIGIMADGHKHALYLELGKGVGFHIAQLHRLDRLILDVVHFLDNVGGHEPDLFVGARAVQHDPRGAKIIPPVNDGHALGKLR